MRVAIVVDTVTIDAEPEWSVTWKKLCAFNGVSFQIFDSYRSEFIDKILSYHPTHILWRSGNGAHNKFKDESQRMFLDRAGFNVLPNWRTHWVYDHKIRQTYLFNAMGIPHPKTWIFFKEKYAMDFVRFAEYPLIVKADGGAGSKSLRFVEERAEARDIIRNTFRKKGKWTGREYEGHVFYAQEYIPIANTWRICMIKGDVAWGYKAMMKPGTKKCSGQGTATMVKVPPEILDFAKEIRDKLEWDWAMFDIIWSFKHYKYMVLEACDTCGNAHHNREFTYYKAYSGGWAERKENTSIQELIFNQFVLKQDKSKRFTLMPSGITFDNRPIEEIGC